VRGNEAMAEEKESSNKNETWDLSRFPDGRKLVGCKWCSRRN
jgi:hypothetical protein